MQVTQSQKNWVTCFKKMGFIYKITSPTERMYVGQTKRIAQRIGLYKHKTRNDYGWKNAKVMNSIKKYGWDAHKFEILEECADDILSEREIFWIDKLKTFWLDNPHHMNMSRGGEKGARPWMHDLERRKKQSERFKGSGGPFYGKTHTKEWREKKSKEVSEYNKKHGKVVPQWGAEKGWAAVMKEVVVYNTKGDCIGEYKSLTNAAKEVGIKLQAVKDSVCYNQWANGAYLFKHKTENYPLTIEVGTIGVKNVKRPVMTLTPEYDVVCEHPSAQEASEFWGVPKTTINRAAMYNWLVPIRTGHVFIYTDLYDQIFKEAS